MKGVTAYIKKDKNQEVQLVFNDVVSTSENDTPDWKHDVLFTSNNYDEKTLKELSLSKEQLAEIGENLVIRLLAINGLLNENT